MNGVSLAIERCRSTVAWFVRCDVKHVEQLALSQEDQPGTHLTLREIARETGFSRRTVAECRRTICV